MTDFGFGQTVAVQIRAKDTAGNTVTTNFSFTAVQDNIAPTIASRTPDDGVNNVARNANISFQLADNIAVVQNQIQVKVGGTNAIVGGVFQSGYTGTIMANGSGFNVTVNPNADFRFSETVGVWVQARDAQNNQLTSSWSFLVKADDVQPVISGRVPAAGSTGREKSTDIVFVATDADTGWTSPP